MDKKSGDGKIGKGANIAGTQEQAQELADKVGVGFGWIRDDGAVCFGDECVVIKPNDKGKLQLTVKPTRCGELTGQVLLDYLIKTAGKGVVIEIPSEVEETKES
ncbi:hypothetical protein ES708_32282 [subsurface metagenome]